MDKTIRHDFFALDDGKLFAVNEGMHGKAALYQAYIFMGMARETIFRTDTEDEVVHGSAYLIEMAIGIVCSVMEAQSKER